MLKTSLENYSPRTEELTPKTLCSSRSRHPPTSQPASCKGGADIERDEMGYQKTQKTRSPLHPSTRSSLLTQPLGYLLPPAWKPHGTVTGPTARQGCDSRWAYTGPLSLSFFICNVGALTQLLESPLMKSKMYFITLLLEMYYELNSHFYNHLGT